jgi:hypothetical protein
LQNKQYRIDELLSKLDGAASEMERLREEKDQEIMILQEGMDDTIKQLNETETVFILHLFTIRITHSIPETEVR